MLQDQIQRGIEELGPWFYAFDFGHGLSTTPAIPPQVAEIHSTRLAMLESAVGRHLGPRTKGVECRYRMP